MRFQKQPEPIFMINNHYPPGSEYIPDETKPMVFSACLRMTGFYNIMGNIAFKKSYDVTEKEFKDFMKRHMLMARR